MTESSISMRRRAFLRCALLLGTAGGAAFLVAHSDPHAGLPCRNPGPGCRDCGRRDTCRMEPAVRRRGESRPIPIQVDSHE